MDSKIEIIKPLFVCKIGECRLCISKKCFDF